MRGRYRGKRNKTERQLCAVVLIAFAAVLFLTMKANSQWTGMDIGEQVYEAVFIAEDWD